MNRFLGKHMPSRLAGQKLINLGATSARLSRALPDAAGAIFFDPDKDVVKVNFTDMRRTQEKDIQMKSIESASPFTIRINGISASRYLRKILTALIVGFLPGLLPAAQDGFQYEVFQNMPLNRVSPEGWQRAYLIKQRDGLTGHLDAICEPFNKNVWSTPDSTLQGRFYKVKNGQGKEVLAWAAFEQSGYYVDGVMRCGLLLQDSFLLDKANKQIHGAIALAAANGVIRGEIPDRWPHAVFFRSFMADYEATGERTILDALTTHYDHDIYSLAGCRSILNIEQLLWLYQQTGRKEYLDRSVKLYEAQASRSRDRMVNKFDDLKSPERQDIHGVTFLETLKLPILLYMATGEKK
jgi:uncharacterized protein